MQTNALKKKRIDEFDMVKGLAILFVCFRHINEITGASALYSPALSRLFSFFESFMILFFIISGYVYTAKGTVWQDICKKAKQLILPLLKFGLLFTAVYFLRYVIIDKKPLLWFADNTLTNFLGLTNWNIRLGQALPNQMLYAFAPYWFLVELFMAFCIFIPVMRLTEKKHVSVKIIAAALLMGASMLLNYFDVQHTVKNTYNSEISFFIILINMFGFASVLMLGNILKEINIFNLDAHSPVFNIGCAVACFIADSIFVVLYANHGYCLQYGGWGPYGCFSIPVTILDGFMLTYFLIFITHYAKKLAVVKKALSFLGQNSLYVLLLHFGVAECICWIGGFWNDVYHEAYPVEKFSMVNWGITVLGTAIVLAAYFSVKKLIQKKRSSSQHSRCGQG